MEIQMSVEVLCEECRNCPQLEFIDKQERTYKGLEYRPFKTTHQLRCKNLQRCERVKKYLLLGGEQLTMKEVEEYAGMDPLGNRRGSDDYIRDQNELKEKVNPCLGCSNSPGNSGKPGNCLCLKRLAYLDGDINKV